MDGGEGCGDERSALRAGGRVGSAATSATSPRASAVRLLTLHVALGVTILVLAAVRLYWRRRAGLPPWAPTLSKAERTFEHWIERALYVLMFAVPLSGLALVFVSDDLVGLHVATHIAFFLALTGHVGLVLKHQFLDRDHLLRRML